MRPVICVQESGAATQYVELLKEAVRSIDPRQADQMKIVTDLGDAYRLLKTQPNSLVLTNDYFRRADKPFENRNVGQFFHLLAWVGGPKCLILVLSSFPQQIPGNQRVIDSSQVHIMDLAKMICRVQPNQGAESLAKNFPFIKTMEVL